MKAYLKTRVWDWALCVAISTGLVFPLFSGFILEDALSASIPLVVIALAGMILLLELISYKRLWIRIGILAGIAALGAYLIYVRSNNVWGDETAHSLGISAALLVMTGLLVYLACRSRLGIVILLVVGNILICGAHFLMFPVGSWTIVLFTLMVFAMFLYRVYMTTLLEVKSGKVRIPQFMRQASLLCLIALLLASGVYYGLVRPLKPPTKDLFLITKLENMDLMKVLGVSSVRELLDPNLISNEMMEELEYTNQMEANEDQEEESEEESEEAEEEKERTEAVRYDISRFRIPWVLIAVCLVLAGISLALYERKRRWQKALGALSAEDQILNYYHYFLKKFGRIGWKKADHYTLYEYADNLEYEMELFITDGISFLDLTDIYVRVIYGGVPASEADVDAYRKFYHAFAANMRKEVGKITYIRKLLWM